MGTKRSFGDVDRIIFALARRLRAKRLAKMSGGWASNSDVNRTILNVTIETFVEEGVLKWLQKKLRGAGYEVTAPEPEDWGWYVYVKGPEISYLVGASSDVDQPDPREWTVQIHRERSLMDKLMGRNKLAGTDQLTKHIERFFRESVGVQNVQVDRSA